MTDSAKKVHEIRKALVLGHEYQYRENPFFKRGIDTLSLVLIDIIEALANHSNNDLEMHELMIKELREKDIYSD